jgi:hypothetical protein
MLSAIRFQDLHKLLSRSCMLSPLTTEQLYIALRAVGIHTTTCGVVRYKRIFQRFKLDLPTLSNNGPRPGAELPGWPSSHLVESKAHALAELHGARAGVTMLSTTL